MRSLELNVGLVLAATMAVGCALEHAPEGPTAGESAEALNGGGAVLFDMIGTVRFGQCAGTLLRDRWFMTTKSTCTPAIGTSVSLKNGAAATVTAPVHVHPIYDVAIARLATPLNPEGQPSVSGPYPLYKGTTAGLLNQGLTCQGWSSSGALRFTVLTVDAVNTSGCGFTSSATECYRLTGSPLLGTGDLGTSCVPSTIFPSRLTGVQTSWTTQKNWQVAVPYFRDWANGLIGSAPAHGAYAGYERSDGIAAVPWAAGGPGGVFRLWEYARVNGNWVLSDLISPTGIAPIGEPSPVVRFDGYSSVFFRTSDNRIRERFLAQGGSTWGEADHNANGAPLATSKPNAYGRADRTTAVVYRATDNRVIELSLAPGASSWGWSDIAAQDGGPLAASDPVGYVRADGVNAVVYRSADNRIRELTLSWGDNLWRAWELSDRAGAPLNATGRLRPYTRSDGVSAIVYRGTDNHIHEIRLSTSGWSYRNLTATTPGAPSASNVSPVAYVRSDGVTAVLYVSADRHIWELSLSGSTWTPKDLTQDAGATGMAGGEFGAFVRSDDLTNSVIFLGLNGLRQELSRAKGSSGAWAVQTLP